MIRALLFLLLSVPGYAASPLVGTWNKDGSPLARLAADGTGTVRGEAVRWKASGRTLSLTYVEDGRVETLFYSLEGAALTVTMDGESETYIRAAPGGAKAPKSVSVTPSPASSDSLSKTLLSSPWCYLRYNQHAGTTRQERAVFRPDGTWSSAARGETYSSGASGTAYGQSDSATGGRWQTKGGRLLMSEGRAALEEVSLKMARNSNGYPILTVEGKEYSQCR